MPEPEDVQYQQVDAYAHAWRDAVLRPRTLRPPRPPEIVDPLPAPAVEWASRAVTRAAAFQTGAIEDLYEARIGTTQIIAEEVEGWESHLEAAGDDVPTKFDDQLSGYAYAFQLATESAQPNLSPFVVRTMHETVTRHQTTIETDQGQREMQHGAWKTMINYAEDRFGRKHLYCPPLLVQSEMDRVFELHQELTELTNEPSALAAFLHWAVAHVHPFDDGNGRTARAIGSVPLLAADRVPLLVYADRKRVYLQALEAADRQGIDEMLRYTRQRAEDTIAWRDSLALRRTLHPTADMGAAILAILEASTEPVEAPVDIMVRIAETAEHEIRDAISPLTAVGFQLSNIDTGNQTSFGLDAAIQHPFPANVSIRADVTMSAYQDATIYELHAYVNNGSINLPRIELLTHDVSPTIGQEGHIRIRVVADNVTAAAINDAYQQLARAARDNGTLPATGLPPILE